MKEKEKAKFMTTNSVYNASDEDSDDVEIQLNGQVTGHHAPTPASSSLNGIYQPCFEKKKWRLVTPP
ncbi:hypothetical protein ANCDUO_27051 [Ancylostoma duodenale]|uniref:Uncharacterized protein n=1 Tax=Ancylostoma duodenale TaxID=51022 RepID=A0A0C2C020_9BILA|nr:hypothetical protein ANCDUO_27051 [Ancylostoma duodenale]